MPECYGGSRKSKAKKGGCDPGTGCGMGGGSRRKSRGRRIRGGAYGAGGPITVGTLENKVAYTGPVDPKSGAAIPDPTDPAGGYSGLGGRRRRKTRKGRKATRKTRKMRGGNLGVGSMKANAGFAGEGDRGLAIYRDVNAPSAGSNPY